MKKNQPFPYFILCTLITFFILGGIGLGCKKAEKVKRSENYLTLSLNDSLFYNQNDQSRAIILRMRIKRGFDHLENRKILDSFYTAQGFHSYFTENFLNDHGLDSLSNYLSLSINHGLNPQLYQSAEIQNLLKKLKNHQYQNLVEAYINLADLELISANSLIKYSRDLSYGRLNPRVLFPSQFNIRFLLPDSTFDNKALSCKNLSRFLDSIQPKKEAYRKMQELLTQQIKSNPENWSGQNPENDTIQKLRVNLERLRWKTSDTTSHYLLVNIPEFRLYAIENENPVWSMKVCLGQRKKEDYDEKMQTYLKSHKIDDRPENHQTPILFSVIQSIQLNPKWSVPKSIFQNEIFYKMIQNPRYLQDNQMKLYIGTKLVSRPDTIHWNKIPRDKIPFTIKQDAGDFNALGKLKFNFQNPYSVYLHDTPEKRAFKKTVRDVSHGCVRVENPLKLAEYLLKGNEKNAMDLLRIKIGLKPGDDSSEHLQKLYIKEQAALEKNDHSYQTSSVLLKTKAPLYIQYFTAGLDDNHKLSFFNDIYRLDRTILDRLQ